MTFRVAIALLLSWSTFAVAAQEKLWVHTLSGTPTGVEQPSGELSRDGHRDQAIIVRPAGLALAPDGLVWVVTSQTVRRIDPDGTVTTIAGVAGERGTADGVGETARFDAPIGIAWSPDGNLYVAESRNDTIRRVSPEGEVVTVAGEPDGMLFRGSLRDGPAAEARFNTPHSLVADTEGNLFIADTLNHAIRKLDTAGMVSTIYVDPTGFALNTPVDIDIDTDGNLYVIDENLHALFRITQQGEKSTVVGTNVVSDRAWGIAVGLDDTLYFADTDNHVIQKVSSGGEKEVVAGIFEVPGLREGRDSLLNRPYDVDVGEDGALYVTDQGNDLVRIAANGPPPTIDQFTVSQTRVEANTEVTLEWRTTGAERVEISGLGEVPPEGFAIAIPAATTTYRLVAINATGPVAQELTVVVDQPRRRGARRH